MRRPTPPVLRRLEKNLDGRALKHSECGNKSWPRWIEHCEVYRKDSANELRRLQELGTIQARRLG